MPKYMTAREIRERFEIAFASPQADALTEVMSAIETERVAEIAELRENLAALIEITTRLVQAQARTEARVEELAQAQARTDESIKALAQAQARTEESIKALVQAQARTDERLTRVEAAVERLAEAQARTEARVEELAQAQARTEARVEELAQAQARTDERLTRVELAVEKLAEAQARTDERLTRVELAVEKLAEAQARTDERLTRVELAVEKLAEAQARSEERLTRVELAIEKLEQAQARTDESIKQLAQAQARTDASVHELRVAVGVLANDIGLNLEEFTAALLPSYLERYYGITELELEELYLDTSKTEDEEIDLMGQGIKDGASITVLVECRARVGGGETRRIAEKFERAVQELKLSNVFKTIVAMKIHPSSQEVARANNIELIPYRKINRDRG